MRRRGLGLPSALDEALVGLLNLQQGRHPEVTAGLHLWPVMVTISTFTCRLFDERSAYLNEALLGAAIVRNVRVCPQHQLPICALDGVFCRTWLHAQRAVRCRTISSSARLWSCVRTVW